MNQFLSLGLLLVLSFQAVNGAGNFTRHGKVNITISSSNNVICRTINYPQSFSGSGKVRVLASISHGESPSGVHHSAVVWTKEVTARGFGVCIMKSGEGSNGTVLVNWVAFQSTPSGIFGGSASVGLFTSNTECTRVDFGKSFSKVPEVLTTVRHSSSNKDQDAMNMWLEDIHVDYFRVCLREVRTFDGKHKNIEVDWIASDAAAVAFSESGHKKFENKASPLEKDKFAYCQTVNFTAEFYAPPVVIVTANHEYDSKNVHSIKPENNVINAWVEEITQTTFRVCIKDKAGVTSQHDPIHVDYFVLGDFDPCIDVTCSYFAVCKAFGPKDARCVCVENCPSYEEPVCSSNGTTYDNECIFEREMCHLRANFTLYHPGSCTGFPSQKGRHRIRRRPSWAVTSCEEIEISQYTFYPDRPVHVQVTVNHVNYTNADYVHEAVVAWVENIRESNFTVCVTHAGRNEKQSDYFATVDWLAYQGAPARGVGGKVTMPTWWTGTNCQSVKLPPGKFNSPPTVFSTAEHDRLGVKHDASSVWLEDVTASSFKLCIRELQNFDGPHERIHVDWIAFEDLHRPLFREHGSSHFKNGHAPSRKLNFAFCKDIGFTKPYNVTPTILITANHSTNNGNLNPEYNSISAWVEYVNTTGFRACAKELFVKKHDPLSISYAVMPDLCDPGWSFFNGSCYFTSSTCESWTNATVKCRRMGSNLVSIRSQEENVFIQHRHNGDNTWIGLNDIATEGFYSWADGCHAKFRFWAKNQPNNLHGNQDCVHTLGIQHDYRWNDIECSACHNYTCEKDFDECTSSPCLNGGTCINKRNNFSCVCTSTYLGHTCEDFDECSSSPCLNGGTCSSTGNSYSCICAPFYKGGQCEGVVDSCKDIHSNQPKMRTGIYSLGPAKHIYQAYCDMSNNGGGWTLIARYSNADQKNWMRDDAYWWYDKRTAQGATTKPSDNNDMLSQAFWSVKGNQVKITRSDDPSHTALLVTQSNCLGAKAFRSYMSSYGIFKYSNSWSNNRCLGSCSVTYGGQYGSTSGFSQAHCDGNIQYSSYIGFWCQWDSGDGAVIMIGGGGRGCSRADHGIGLTENDNGGMFTDSGTGEYDFGDDAGGGSSSYSLNLWIK